MDLAAARDIAIIILAVINIITLIVLAILLYVLIQLVRHQIVPLMRSVKRTVDTVEGTTAYVSRSAVSPIARVAGLTVAAAKFFQVLSGRVRRKK